MRASRAVVRLAALVAFAAAGLAPLPGQSVLSDLDTLLGRAGLDHVSPALEVLLLLTLLAVAPTLLVLTTSFTRVIVVLSFLRSAIATQNVPPNQVLVALALFLTFFIMAPVFQTIGQEALTPFLAGTIGEVEFWERAATPVRQFMLRQTREADLALFMGMAGMAEVDSPEHIPLYVLVPAFAISELKTAFQIGFLLFLPFLVLDMVVASSLMAMGMFMIPPMMVSLPFKLLLFVTVDGWHLVVQSLLTSFR